MVPVIHRFSLVLGADHVGTVMNVKLINITPDAEKLMGFIARVSNPANQDNANVAGLLAYCIRHGHWSVFEQAHMTVEITTTRAIAPQLLRHNSFRFQEFSQRYAAVTAPAVLPALRRQDSKNRQNSIDDIPEEIRAKYLARIADHFVESQRLYEDMLADGIAKECAREVLPLATPTTLYMTGDIRSWIHYTGLRSGNGTQAEHRDIALAIQDILFRELPTVARALTEQ
jgi:thymidylate synthase (FAD)